MYRDMVVSRKKDPNMNVPNTPTLIIGSPKTVFLKP